MTRTFFGKLAGRVLFDAARRLRGERGKPRTRLPLTVDSLEVRALLATATVDVGGASNVFTPRAITIHQGATRTPPVVVTAVRFAQDARRRVTRITIDFSGAVNAAEATDLATYRLASADKRIHLRAASYDPALGTVTLTPRKPLRLHGPARLRVDGVDPGGLHDRSGRLIDGDRNGRPGGDAVAVLRRRGHGLADPVFPPHITGVTATIVSPSSPTGTSRVNIYKVGGFGGTNTTPQTIAFQFDHGLDPTTVNDSTVLLEGSGGDGLFGNINDSFYNLSGKLDFNSATNVLTIHLADRGLILNTDEYRVMLVGTGSSVISDPQGNALDGENTLNDDPNNPQLPLPSGDGIPGGNFFLTFIVNTSVPVIVG
jgi:hypothetical protein